MPLIPMFAMAAALLVVAAFVQWTIPRFTRGTANTWAARLLLVLLGIAVGITLARMTGAASDVALFLVGFGLVHVPPAVVLLLKRWRRESPS